MKAFYQEFFCTLKHEKIRDKVIAVRLMITILVILFCLIAMSLSAYAYFSHNLVSRPTRFQSANFDIDVSVVDEANGRLSVNNDALSSDTVSLNAGVWYTVTLKPLGTAKTGFCVVCIERYDGEYHTQQLGADGDLNTTEITFKIKLNNAAKVSFFAYLGTSVMYGDDLNTVEHYIGNGEEVVVANRSAITEATTTQATVTTISTTTQTTIASTQAEETTGTTAQTTTVPVQTEVTTITVTGTSATTLSETTTTMDVTTTLSSQVTTTTDE